MNPEQILALKAKAEEHIKAFTEIATALKTAGYTVIPKQDNSVYIYKNGIVEEYGDAPDSKRKENNVPNA